MKVLIVFHGMPPIAGRTVVGSGLRAFANGETLRAAGHEVLYCTRHEDLPADLKAKARRAAPGGSLLLTAVTGPVAPPGDRSRRRAPPTAALDAVLGPAPAAIGMAPDSLDPGMPPDWTPSSGSGWTPIEGLAPVGGPLGAPGNPLAFTEPHDLQANIAKVAPDVVLVESIEAARYVQDGPWTVILDLFAPRLLEQQFQTGATDTREAVRVLDALQRADRFLFSNERQKYFHLPLLALAGIDCTREAGGVVPISCPPDSPPFMKPAELTFVAGGVFWPWADLSGGLRDLLACLDRVDSGKVRLYGGEYGIRSDTQQYSDPRDKLPKDHERVEFAGMVPIDTLWEQYRRGSVAFDLMAPNPEREINLSFRQIDYLRCGLPIITSPSQVIASDIEEYGAGWLIEPDDRQSLERLVRKLATNPKLIAEAATAAQALARDRYAWTVSGAELVAAVEASGHRDHGETLFATLARTQADLWEEFEDAKRLRLMAERQGGELDKKSEEVAAQDGKIRQLLTTVDRLTLSLEEVSRFRTETVGYLAQEQDTSLREAAELQRELDRRDLDVKKKDKALGRAQAEVAKLKAAISELETQNRALQTKYSERDADVLGLTEEARAQRDRYQALQSELAGAKREVVTREAALADLAAQVRTQEAAALDRLQRAEAAARKLLAASETRLGEERAAHGHLRQESAELASRLASLERDLRKKSEELAHARASASKALEEQVDRAQTELTVAQARAEQLLRQVAGKLAKSEQERAQLQVEASDARAAADDATQRLELERDRSVAELQKKAQEHDRIRRELEASQARSLAKLNASHEADVLKLRGLHEQELESKDAARARENERLRELHRQELAKADAVLDRELEKLRGLHAQELAKRDQALDRELEKLRGLHAEELARVEAQGRRELDKQRAEAETLRANHVQELARADEVLAREQARHERAMARKDAALQRELDKAQALVVEELGKLTDLHERDLRRLLEERREEIERRDRAQEKEARKRDELHAAELDRLRVAAEAEREKLAAHQRQEIGKLQAAAETERAKLAALHERQIEKLQAEAVLERDKLIALHEQHAEKLQADAAAEREKQAAHYEKTLTAQAAKLERELAQRDALREREVARLRAEAEAELAKRETQREQDIERMATEAHRELAKKTAEWQARLDAVEAARLRQISELEQAQANAILAKDAELARERERADAVLHRELGVRDAAIAEAERLRTELEARFLQALAAAENAAQASLQAATARIEGVAQERGELAASLEEAEFERHALRGEIEKKNREIVAAASKLTEARAELDTLQLRVGELTVQVEQKDYAVRSLSADAGKKGRELEEALSQRAQLQADLDGVAPTLRGLETQRDELLEHLNVALAAVQERDDELARMAEREVERERELAEYMAREATLAQEGDEGEEPETTPPAPPTAEA